VRAHGRQGTFTARATDYSDDTWREADTENMARSSARQRNMATDPTYTLAFMKSGGRTWWDATGNQLADLNSGRVRDLAADAGLSPVGDWAGSNADRVGRETP
jgi:hypothetical protein